MKKKIFLIVLGVLFIAGLLLSVRAYKTLSQKVAPAAENKNDTAQSETAAGSADFEKAADFKVYDLDGSKVSLSEKAGKPVVVNIWATWCPPCQSELPHFNSLYNELKDEVEFMMVDLTDGHRETVDKVKSFVEENGYDFPVYCDSDLSAADAYSVSSVPLTLFIDKDGNLISQRLGAMDEETLRDYIETIRGE